MPRTVIIDTDPGIDDVIALMLACSSPELEIAGVTVVGGNAPLDVTVRNAAGALNLMGSQVPLVAGLGSSGLDATATHGAGGLGPVTLDPGPIRPVRDDAPAFIVEQVRSHPGEVTLITLGPLTNIAAALELDPDLGSSLAGLTMMGGAEGAGNRTPSAEFNIWHDPEAARRVFAAGLPNVTMVGLDATLQCILTGEHRDHLATLARREGWRLGQRRIRQADLAHRALPGPR